MDLTNINKVGNMTEFLPTKKLINLSNVSEYPVTKLTAVQTRFGKRVVAEINEEFAIFLPPRFSKVLESDQVLFGKMAAAAHDKTLYMKYNGVSFLEFAWDRDGNNKDSEGNADKNDNEDDKNDDDDQDDNDDDRYDCNGYDDSEEYEDSNDVDDDDDDDFDDDSDEKPTNTSE